MNSMTHDSKTFCVLPWIHLYVTPQGVAAPCCISKFTNDNIGVGTTRTHTLTQLVNSSKMQELRVNMLTGVRHPSCSSCYAFEDQGISSPRCNVNREYADKIDSITMMPDGSLTDFKMRYFDIRFSNICNFKCRTCGPEFSSQWEQEDKKRLAVINIIPKNDRPGLIREVVDQIQYMDQAYFAGGEPLITEEHYILLEEMIRQQRTDIQLKYNTNLSNLKFKDKDLLGLWKHFSKDIMVYASIDHYGARAEYIRHGTNWAQVENNFVTVKKTPYIHLQMNTVVSIYNYVTLGEFYDYLIDHNLYTSIDQPFSAYNMTSPEFLNAQCLPPALKSQGRIGLEKTSKTLTVKRFGPLKGQQLLDNIKWVESDDTWETHKETFRTETSRLDHLRGEDFCRTFPELARLMNE